MSGQGTVVLVVDDEPLVARAVSRYLTRAGAEADIAATAQEALDRIDAGLAPWAVVTDLEMPGIHGLELIRRLRGRLPELRIVAMTGFETETLGPEAVAAGADVCLAKPLEPRVLLAQLGLVMRRPESR